ncbi:MAG: hypothetical protein FWD42_06205, partial [Solirubrobacterales bacterium]|nr:hypothetical protein [Solirubrobacterales bacterium]
AVWVTSIASVSGGVQRALVSSTLAPGASSFGEPFIVDPNVSEGEGVDPSLALAANGDGLVTYRVVTGRTITPLRPGDVLAEIRIARYEGGPWSSPERVNRNPLLSMRAPSAGNGPQVALGRGNQAVVAWQEPEGDGAARIWARRVFGTTLGLALQASPTTYGGQPLTDEADAFALSVSPYGAAKVVSRVEGVPGTPLVSPRLFVNTLQPSSSSAGGQFSGSEPLPGASGGGLGAPSVAVDDQGDYRIAFTAGPAAETMVGSEQSGATVPEVPLGPAATASGAGAVTALNAEGGGVTAWPAGRSQAAPSGVGVREDFPSGAAQAALVSGGQLGAVSELSAGGSESGEALLGFREGAPGTYEIVGEGVTVPPPAFSVETPRRWVRPQDARVTWTSADDATGGVTYALVLDGRVVQRGIHALSVLPDPRLLGAGVRHAQILATDAAGQQTLSPEGELKIDAPPVARVRHRRGRTVVVRVADGQSGALPGATAVSFGDGRRARGRLTFHHTYSRPGRYLIVVHMRDGAGEQATAHLRVNVR